jgi:excisionase family DNA binding protein
MTIYLTITQAAERWDRPRPTVKRWCQAGAIPGVFKVGRQYAIPDTATPPKLLRGRPRKQITDDPAARAAVAGLPAAALDEGETE